MGPVWSLFFTHSATQNDLNCPKSGIFDHTGLVEAFRGHLGPFGAIWGLFLSDFRAQSKRLGPVWRIFFTHLATQNDLNGSILVQWDRGITILDWWRPLGAILGHFGLILELRARGWGLFGAYFSPIWLDKMT